MELLTWKEAFCGQTRCRPGKAAFSSGKFDVQRRCCFCIRLSSLTGMDGNKIFAAATVEKRASDDYFAAFPGKHFNQERETREIVTFDAQILITEKAI